MNNPVLERRIGNFAHAVSRDERRWSFRPLVMTRNGQKLSLSGGFQDVISTLAETKTRP